MPPPPLSPHEGLQNNFTSQTVPFLAKGAGLILAPSMWAQMRPDRGAATQHLRGGRLESTEASNG